MALRGVEEKTALERRSLLRDIRPTHVQFLEALRRPEAAFLTYSILGSMLFFAPSSFEMVAIGALGLYPILKKTKYNVPLRKRKGLHEIDEDDIHPATKKPQKSRGILFLGNRKEDSAEVWLANEDSRTHFFIIGSTGAGKTEGLIGMTYNPLVWGSGFSYSDGKGDISFWGKSFGQARSFGREDDVLVINYMTAGADTTVRRVNKLSNSYNPYQVGNADSNIQLTTSLMDAAGSGGDMWKGRAISFLTSIICPLTDLRNNGHMMLHIGRIREHMPFLKYVDLMNDERITDRSRDMMKAFLSDVPGYNPTKGIDKQSSTFLEQYGYQQMQFTRIMSSLADTYGHIFAAQQAEVNLKDVAINCRILLVLLPALEKSRPELGNLGKIVVAGMKNMMGSQLGGDIQGSKRELLDARATNSPSPFLMIFDEFGYFMPEDTALMWAQARSLGFALCAAGQDIQAFYRTSKEETLAIFGSSNVKILGKLEDPTDTFELFSSLAGEAYVSELDGYEIDEDSFTGGYRTNMTAKIQKVSRIDILDLKDQIEGEVHIFFKTEIIRANMFYTAAKAPKYMMPNYFVEVLKPTDAEVAGLQIQVNNVLSQLDKLNESIIKDELSCISSLRKTPFYAKYTKQLLGAEAGISMFIMLHNPDKYLVQDEPTEEGGSIVKMSNTPVNDIDHSADLVSVPEGDITQEPDSKPNEHEEQVSIDNVFAENPVAIPPVNDPVIQTIVAAAAPILSTILFTDETARQSVLTNLQEAATLSGYDKDAATALVRQYEQEASVAVPDDEDVAQGPDRMNSALEAMENLFS